MKTLGRIYYVILGVGFVALIMAMLVGQVRSGRLEEFLAAWPWCLGGLVILGAAIGLAYYSSHRPGEPLDESQFGCSFLIALGVLIFLAAVGLFFWALATG